MNSPDLLLQRQRLTDSLLQLACDPRAAEDPNRPLLASLLAGQMIGQGCLDHWLNLGKARWQQMVADHFRGLPPLPARQPPMAIPEWEDLQKLLLEHRANRVDSEIWMADIVASACAGADHLWQDLGLASRAELSRLMQLNFPALAAANSGDMKWKKFLYRQFCAREGIYVCPAPSCGVCIDYAKCFSPEH